MSVDVLAVATPPPAAHERTPPQSGQDRRPQPQQQNSRSDRSDRSDQDGQPSPRQQRRLSITAPESHDRTNTAERAEANNSFRQHLDDGKPDAQIAAAHPDADIEAEAEPPLLELSLQLAEDIVMETDLLPLPPAIAQLLNEDDGEVELAHLIAELFPQLIPQLQEQGILPSEALEDSNDHLLRDEEGEIIGVMVGDQLYPVQLQVEHAVVDGSQAASVSSSGAVATAAPAALAANVDPEAKISNETLRPARNPHPAAQAPLVAAAPVTGEAMPQVVLPVSESSLPESQLAWQGSSTNGAIDISRLASASTPSEPPPPQGSSEAERAIEQQIKRALIQQMANGDRSMTLRLTPPHLGTVRIEIVEQRGMLTVRFSAEDDRVRQALERQLPQLRQDLRASDAPVSSVRLDDHQSGWQQDHQQRQQQAHSRSSNQGQGRFRLDGEEGDSDEGSLNSSSSSATSALGGIVSDNGVDARA